MKRIISLILVIATCFSLYPTVVLAEEDNTPTEFARETELFEQAINITESYQPEDPIEIIESVNGSLENIQDTGSYFAEEGIIANEGSSLEEPFSQDVDASDLSKEELWESDRVEDFNESNADQSDISFSNSLMFTRPPLPEDPYPYIDIVGPVREATTGFTWSDKYFLDNANELNPDMAKAAVALAMASYSRSYIRTFLDAMGFTIVDNCSYPSSYPLTDNDHVAYTIAKKTIGSYSAYIVAVRGTTGNEEWLSNFNFGSGGMHTGFACAALEVYSDIYDKLTADGNDKVILVTGHSRGAAVANILSAMIVNNGLADASHVFGYTFACPAVTTSPDSSFANIFNFNNYNDIISAVPLESWGFGRYGNDINVENHTSQVGTRPFIETLEALFPTIEDANTKLAKAALTVVAGKLMDNTNWGSLLSYIEKNIFQDIDFEDISAGIFAIGWYILKTKFPFLDKGEQIVEVFSLIEGDIESGKFKEYSDFLYIVYENSEGIPANEFRGWILNNGYSEKIKEIEEYVGITITERESLLTVRTALNNDATGYTKFFGICLNLLEAVLDADGSVSSSIMDAHCSPTYLYMVNSAYYGYGAYRGTNIQAVRIPSGIRTLAPECFKGCSSLWAVDLPDSIEYIPRETFMNCTSLRATTFDGAGMAIDIISFPAKVKVIGDSAFNNCTAITEVNLPDTLELVDKNAFYGCSGIKTLSMPIDLRYYNEIRTFDYECKSSFTGCTGIENVTLTPGKSGIGWDYIGTASSTSPYYGTSTFSYYTTPWYISGAETLTITVSPGISYLGKCCFYKCGNVSEVVMDKSVENIGSDAFSNCGLSKLIYSGTASDWSQINFSNEWSNPGYNGAEVYLGEELLTKVELDSSVTEVKQYAFYNNENITEVNLPDTLELVDKNAFYGCSGIKTLRMPIDLRYYNEIRTFDYECKSSFTGCAGIESISLTPGKSGIGWDYVGTAPSTSPYYGTATFSYYTTPWYISDAETLTITVFPGISYLGKYCFYKCGNISEVVMDKSVENIGSDAFSNCGLSKLIYSGTASDWSQINFSNERSNPGYYGAEVYLGEELLTQVELDSSVTEVKQYAFYNNKNITEVNLPDTVELVNKDAFYGCSGIETLRMPIDLRYYNEIRTFDYECKSPFTGCTGIENVTLTPGKSGVGWDYIQTRSSSSPYYGTTTFSIYTTPWYISDAEDLTIIISSGISYLGEYCFRYCSNICNIIFYGTAPIFAGSTFSNNTLNAYYYENGSWTNENMLNYGGTITWIPITTEEKLQAVKETYLSYADAYFNNTPIQEPSEEINSVTDSMLAKYEVQHNDGLSKRISYEGITLQLDGEMLMLRFVFLPSDKAADCIYSIDDMMIEPEENGEFKVIRLSGITAENYDETHTVSVTDGEDTLTVTASPLSYVYCTFNQEDLALNNLGKTIYLCYLAAENYLANII